MIMFRLKYLPDCNEFEVHSNKQGAYRGDLKSIIKKSIDIGIDSDDLEIALIEMENNRHPIAEFGILGKFLYTRNK